MKVVVEIPFDRYYRLLAILASTGQEAEILKSGRLDADRQQAAGVGTVKISCDVEEARKLLDCAMRLYPEAAPDFERAIDLSSRV